MRPNNSSTMTYDEKRFIRREWINYYIQGNDCIYSVTACNVWEKVRATEKWLRINCSIYSK